MRLYFERIDPEEDKFVATVKGDSKVLLDLLDWYLNYTGRRQKSDVVNDIKKQVENARRKFENDKNKS